MSRVAGQYKVAVSTDSSGSFLDARNALGTLRESEGLTVVLDQRRVHGQSCDVSARHCLPLRSAVSVHSL